jgi:hypothetical protein
MAITMRMVVRIFVSSTEATQGPLLSVHYTHIKRPPNSRCVFLSGLEDTAKMTAHSRSTGIPDLAGDPLTCALDQHQLRDQPPSRVEVAKHASAHFGF